MLLQTNSYIVPRDKRVEHARLLRRFRQTLLRLGCDHFEVYEQVGPNWNTSETTGRYVQIMRFRDRKHQMEVQAAERTDKTAQALVQEFCDLVNFTYQQQQGLFAVGFYTSFLRMPSPIVSTSAAQPSAEQAEAPAAADDHEHGGFVEVAGRGDLGEERGAADENGQEDPAHDEAQPHAAADANGESEQPELEVAHSGETDSDEMGSGESHSDEAQPDESNPGESHSDEARPAKTGLTPGGSGRMSDTGSHGLGVLSMPGLSDQPQEPLDAGGEAQNEVDLNDQSPLDLDDASILQELMPFSDDNLGFEDPNANEKAEPQSEDFNDPDDRAASSKS